jgi:hypothetical protein
MGHPRRLRKHRRIRGHRRIREKQKRQKECEKGVHSLPPLKNLQNLRVALRLCGLDPRNREPVSRRPATEQKLTLRLLSYAAATITNLATRFIALAHSRSLAISFFSAW